jgi:tRNA (mo5U34)-methyltransferase
MKVSQAETDALPWFHSIDLGDGVVTKGSRSLQAISKKADVVFKHGVAGKSVIDIGAWDGAYSFEAERRGAIRVLATDFVCWGGASGKRKRSFDFAKQSLGSCVEEQIIDVPQISVDTVGRFDVVLFLGVFYHLKHPFLMLERLAPVATEMLILDTETALDDEDRPAMVFFPGKELNNDDQPPPVDHRRNRLRPCVEPARSRKPHRLQPLDRRTRRPGDDTPAGDGGIHPLSPGQPGCDRKKVRFVQATRLRHVAHEHRLAPPGD